MAGQSNQLQEAGALQVAASLRLFPSETEILSAGQQVGSLCTLHLLPLPPFLLGNRELIRPATHLAYLIPAEEEPANPKLLMLKLRLCAGTFLWWLRCRAGQAVPACRGAEMPTLLAAAQLQCPPRDRTRGSHESLLV